MAKRTANGVRQQGGLPLLGFQSILSGWCGPAALLVHFWLLQQHYVSYTSSKWLHTVCTRTINNASHRAAVQSQHDHVDASCCHCQLEFRDCYQGKREDMLPFVPVLR